MGMGNANQNYRYNPVTGQYTDIQGYPINNPFVNRAVAQPKQKSPINDLLSQAMSAQPAVPTLAQLFPTLLSNTGGILGQGQYGAGRFLGNNVVGNPSLTSTAMNVT